MSGRRQKDGKGPFHIRLQEWMLKGPAYRALSCRARCLLVELYRFYKGEDSDTNGNIYLSVRHAAARLNCSKTSAMHAFEELVAFGFIRPTVRSAFSWKHGKATRWALTEFPCGNKVAEKTFMDLSATKANEIATALALKWAAENRGRRAPGWQREAERGVKKAPKNRKRGPSRWDAVSQPRGHCPSRGDTFEAECPSREDTFGQTGVESVPAVGTEISYQVGGASAPEPHQHDGDPAPPSTATEPSSASSDPPSATTTPTQKGRAKKIARRRASKSTTSKRRRT